MASRTSIPPRLSGAAGLSGVERLQLNPTGRRGYWLDARRIWRGGLPQVRKSRQPLAANAIASASASPALGAGEREECAARSASSTGRALRSDSRSNRVTSLLSLDSAPSNLLPAGPGAAVQDTDTPLTGISVADVDAGADDNELTLSVDHGTLTVDTGVVGSLGALQVTGNGASAVVITASPAQINAAPFRRRGARLSRGRRLHRPPTPLPSPAMTSDTMARAGR